MYPGLRLWSLVPRKPFLIAPRALLTVALAASAMACGSDDTTGDSGSSTAPDAGTDASSDSQPPPDVGQIPSDSGDDSATDASTDGSNDTGADSSDSGGQPDSSDGGSDGGSSVASVKVPVREAVLFYMRHKIGAKTDADLWRPYVSYVDRHNKVIDSYMFDTFVFLDMERIVEEHPTKTSWTFFLDQLFTGAKAGLPAPRAWTDVPNAGALLTKGNPIAQTHIKVSGGRHLFSVWTKTDAPGNGREALIAFSFRDASGQTIKSGVTGLTWSEYIGGKWYRYLASTKNWQQHTASFVLPSNVAEMDVQIQLFSCQGTVNVDRVQVVAGNKPMTYQSWAAAGFSTLVANGDFRSSSSWTALRKGPGVERAIVLDSVVPTATQAPVDVRGGSTYTLAARLKAQQDSTGHEGILGVRVLDAAGNEITKGLSGMTYSTATTPHMFYRYADTSTSWTQRSVTFTVPASAAKVQVYLVNWDKKSTVSFDQVQLVEGSRPLSESQLAAKGYETLIHDGSAEGSGSVWERHVQHPMPSRKAVIGSLDRAAVASGDIRRRNVIIGIPVGVGFGNKGTFGVVGGKTLDLGNAADREAALNWFVDEALDRWKAAAPKALDLVGFYWMHESKCNSHICLDDLAGKLRQKLNAKGLWLTGSPYRRWLGSSQCYGSSYDLQMASQFDRIWQQPNVWPGHHWNMTRQLWDRIHDCLCKPGGKALTFDQWMQYGYPPCELAKVDSFISQFQKQCGTSNPSCHVHVNIEWVPGLESELGYGRVLDYLNVDKHLTHDFGRFTDRMWYEAAGFGWRCALDADDIYRRQYDTAHQFIQDNHKRHGFPAGK